MEISKYIVPCTDLLKNLPGYYSNATLQGKRLIIGSIFSGKLIFEKKYYRTTGVDPVFEDICSTSSGSGGNKNGTFRFNFEKSHLVPAPGDETNKKALTFVKAFFRVAGSGEMSNQIIEDLIAFDKYIAQTI